MAIFAILFIIMILIVNSINMTDDDKRIIKNISKYKHKIVALIIIVTALINYKIVVSIMILFSIFYFIEKTDNHKGKRKRKYNKSKIKTTEKLKLSPEQLGTIGEDILFNILNKTIKDKKIILRNQYLTHNKKTTEIDLILIHKTGTYVFESKNFKGWIYGTINNKTWTQVFNKYNKKCFYNPVMQNEKHIEILKKHSHNKNNTYISIIVFGDQAELKKIEGNTESNTYIKNTYEISFLMKNLIRNSETMLSEEEMEHIRNAFTINDFQQDIIRRKHLRIK